MNKLFVILFVIFATPCFGADYLETFVDYRYNMRDKLNLDTASTGGLDDTTAHKHIRESVMFNMPLLTMRLIEDTITTTKYDGVYSLDSLSLGVVTVEWRNNDSVKTLVYAPKESWYQIGINPNLSKISRSKRYDRLPSYYDFIDSQLFLFPIPITGADSFFIQEWQKLPNFIDGDSLHLIPVQYRIIILRYATYLAGQAMVHLMTQLFYRDFQDAVRMLGDKYARIYKVPPPATNSP